MHDEPMAGELLPVTSPQVGDHLPADAPADEAVLAAFDAAAANHLADIRPAKTVSGYARDWQLWLQFLDWTGERTGRRLPDTAVTRGTLVAFVVWLDQVLRAAPNSIDRRITGVTVTARREHGVEVPKEATVAARAALKPLKVDPARIARGRGKAPAATPEQIRAMNTTVPTPSGRKKHVPPELALLRDRTLASIAFGIGGRVSEVSALTVDGITLEGEGLKVYVPSVKGRPARTVPVAFGEHAATCPVRLWLTWREKLGRTDGPAFVPVDETGRLGTRRLSPDGCRIAITRAAQRAGLDTRLTGHSMRAGLVTTARKKGKRVEKIRAQTGHAMNSPVFWEYVREGELWEDAATDGLGL
ncbi:tyrosine-type recombinase/integrase [Streptomyces nitrosporeus]|uniref:tyrosine-type recombinase/integrase n=1 Tax=Streptomyces nitrosporeus TaxID=28894 RepID=UPI00167E0EDF|nr:tyrosine-type recombinase/integrase [Streptomyces nitrosporeus]GGZ27895.1 integrase [Streptomyces nitrosporeus]